MTVATDLAVPNRFGAAGNFAPASCSYFLTKQARVPVQPTGIQPTLSHSMHDSEISPAKKEKKFMRSSSALKGMTGQYTYNTGNPKPPRNGIGQDQKLVFKRRNQEPQA